MLQYNKNTFVTLKQWTAHIGIGTIWPAEGALSFYTSKFLLKVHCTYTSWNVCSFSMFFTFLMNINRMSKQFICNNGVTVTFKTQISFLTVSFHPLLHCKVFVVGQGCSTMCYCPGLPWILMTCATLLIYMDSCGMAVWICIQVFIPLL